MTNLQTKLLDTFKVFSKFCEKHGLKYYAAFGTCLGAVRHKGFIPWDDDMDVYMMRADYQRLMSLRNELDDTIYRVTDVRDGIHPYPFAKFYTTDCSIWEVRQFPFIIGPWIDVFPIDEWGESKMAVKLYDDYHSAMWNYRKALSTQSWKEIWTDIRCLNGFNGPIKLVKKCCYSPFKKLLFKKALRQLEAVTKFKGAKLKDWNYLKAKTFEKEWFEKTVDLPFENTIIKCPKMYDKYLSYIYGDYMTPPPREKRISSHSCYYINLTCCKSIDEIIKEKLAEGSLTTTEKKPLSFKVLIDELKHRKGF